MYEIEPWGFEVEEERLAILGTTIAATAGASVEPSKFRTRPPPDGPPPSNDLEAFEKAFGTQQPPEDPSTSKEKL